MPKTVKCLNCSGTGRIYNPVTRRNDITCSACKGKGYDQIP